MFFLLQPSLSSPVRVSRLLQLAGLLWLALMALPAGAKVPQGEFNFRLNLQERNASSGKNLQNDFVLQPGRDGFARGAYRQSDSPVLQLDFRSARYHRDYAAIKLRITHFKGPGRYPVDTAFNAAAPDMYNFLEVHTGGGTFFDPRQTGFGVLQYRSGWHWQDDAHRTRSLPDIGGVIEIESIDGNIVSGKLLLVLYGATQGYPGSKHPTDIRRAAITGTFRAYIYGLQKR